MNDDRMDEFIDEFLLRFKKATGFDFKTGKLCASTVPPRGEPLIQGYTAEQWQEIIDGGYLVQVRDSESKPWVPSELVSIDGKLRMEFVDNCGDGWQFCRPAQLKGVMRPIFVEPGDKKNAFSTFFDKDGKFASQGGWYHPGETQPDFDEVFHKTCIRLGITKYIEV